MTARDLIVEADKLRQDQGMTQAEWCRKSGYDEYGKLISNAYKRGNCKLTVLMNLLRSLGYELTITKVGEKK